MKDDFLVVGKITKPHGLRGEVKIIAEENDPNKFKKIKKYYIDNKEVNVEQCKMQHNRVILKLEGIDSVEEAEMYRNKLLKIKRSEAEKLPKDVYYVIDLEGCEVFDTEETYLGKVYDVIETGSNDVYWVKDGKKEVLIPAMKTIVESINIDEKKIVIRPVSEWMD